MGAYPSMHLAGGMSAQEVSGRGVQRQRQRQTPSNPEADSPLPQDPEADPPHLDQRHTLPPLSPEMTIEAGGAHPTGMYSYFYDRYTVSW